MAFDPQAVADSIRRFATERGFITPKQAALLKKLGYDIPLHCHVRECRPNRVVEYEPTTTSPEMLRALSNAPKEDDSEW